MTRTHSDLKQALHSIMRWFSCRMLNKNHETLRCMCSWGRKAPHEPQSCPASDMFTNQRVLRGLLMHRHEYEMARCTQIIYFSEQQCIWILCVISPLSFSIRFICASLSLPLALKPIIIVDIYSRSGASWPGMVTYAHLGRIIVWSHLVPWLVVHFY